MNFQAAHPLITSLRSDESSSYFEELNPQANKDSKQMSHSLEQSIQIDMPLQKLHQISRSLQVSEEIDAQPRKTSRSAILQSQVEEPEKEENHQTRSLKDDKPVIQSKSEIIGTFPMDITVKKPYSQLIPAQPMDESLSSSKVQNNSGKGSTVLDRTIASAILAGVAAVGVFFFTKKKRYAAAVAAVVFGATYDTLRKSD